MTISRKENKKLWIELIFKSIESGDFKEAAQRTQFYGNVELRDAIASEAISHGLPGYAFLDACSEIGFF